MGRRGVRSLAPSLVHACLPSFPDTPLSDIYTHARAALGRLFCSPMTGFLACTAAEFCALRGCTQSKPDPIILKHSSLLPPTPMASRMKTRCLTAALQAPGGLPLPPSLHAPLVLSFCPSAPSTCQGPGPLGPCCSLWLECLSSQKAQTDRAPAFERGSCALLLGSLPPHTWSPFPELPYVTHFPLPEASQKQNYGTYSFVWLWCPEGRLGTGKTEGGLALSGHPPPRGNTPGRQCLEPGAWLGLGTH